VKQTTASGPITLAGKAAKAPAYVHEAAGVAYVVDAGINMLYSGNWYRFNVKPTKASREAASQPVKIYGCLCMNIDVIREQASLPAMTTGDHLVLHPVGAYNITQSMQFITYRPAVVMIGLDGRVDVIREREDLDYVQRLERVPDHLLAPSRL
jgi:diaminopimelate decarboxylase